MPLSLDLTGRRALVTGVTSGIGVGIARKLFEAGCDIVGCGQRAPTSPEAQAFRRLAAEAGRSAHYLPVDLRDAQATRTFARDAAALLGGLDIVVSNAGRNIFKGVDGCREADWAECMNLDLAAHWRLGQECAPALRQGREALFIIIGSNHAYSTIPGCFPYNVAKAGLVAMVQSMALEWGPAIRAVGIAPGFIDTAGNDTWFASFPDPAAERRRTERTHPVGRIGTPDEIGGLCAFLASPYAAFISGTTLLVDGGRSAVMLDANG